jgi:rhodanese-related sulfurtransferase
MKTKVFERIPLLPGAVAVAVAIWMWGNQQYSAAPGYSAPQATAPGAPAHRAAAPRIPVIDIGVFDAATAMIKGAMVIDVRSRDTYAEGHIAGAISMPIEELERRAPELAAATSVEYIVYCGNGSSLGPQAARALTAAGHPSTRNLAAGFSGWKDAGQAVASGLK